MIYKYCLLLTLTFFDTNQCQSIPVHLCTYGEVWLHIIWHVVILKHSLTDTIVIVRNFSHRPAILIFFVLGLCSAEWTPWGSYIRWPKQKTTISNNEKLKRLKPTVFELSLILLLVVGSLISPPWSVLWAVLRQFFIFTFLCIIGAPCTRHGLHFHHIFKRSHEIFCLQKF